MASRDINDLHPEVKEKAEIVQQACKEAAGFDLLIYSTLRPLEEQAKLFRQSRSKAEIDLKCTKFRVRGFDFLADVIQSVGPCYGNHVTNAAPGESWHNYGEAWDAVPLVGGKPVWSYFDGKEMWNAYGEAVRQVGMHWAGDWTRFREYPHAQLQVGSNPLKLLPPDKIKKELEKRKLL